jgi:transcriptional regulator with XRE-family HTH domain
VAAAIDVTDRTYKNYEQEKRDLPSAAAVEISRRFGVSLVWLLTGQGNSTSGDDPELAASCSFAVLSEAQLRSADLEIEKLSKIIGFVAEQAAQTGEHPSGVAKKYFDTL